MSARSRMPRAVGLAAATLLTLAVGSVFVLAPHCDRRIGDETDFPLLIAAGEAACGARALISEGTP
jgi:hypothetical protein